MYAVIGTAGHVDHGKSALIEALSGTHPSHLPQELARGMTIDLGFACLRSPEGDEVGIIDVPGHERFLRNMLSSLWGLDLVLFVVAADEGWSSLSEEHLRVIAALGIRRIVVAITKCDLVDSLQINCVEDAILERFLSISDMLPGIWRVSAKTGDGISALKEGLLREVRSAPEPENLLQSPHLYIDRVFTVNGIGTTVTGTLRGGAISVGDTLCLFPGNRHLKVKSLQSYHLSRDTALPRSRVAMSFRQLKKDNVSRGDCLATPGAEITVCREWIVKLQSSNHQLKKQCDLEIALGTTNTHARCYLLGDGCLARLQLAKPLPAFWGQKVLLIMPGGSRFMSAGRVVWTGALDREQRPRLIRAMREISDDSLDELRCRSFLAVKGYVQKGSGSLPEQCRETGNWWLTENYYEYCLKHASLQLERASSALSEEGLSLRTAIPVELLRALLEEQCNAKCWQQSAEGISLAGACFNQLSQQHQILLNEINECGPSCFSARQNCRPGLNSQLRVLVEKKLIVPMDDQLFITSDHYHSLRTDLLSQCMPGDLLSVADVRKIIGLSRKQLLPLLNRMERDGWVRRENDLRRIKKTR